MFLVDTNVVSELPRRRPVPSVLRWLESQPSIAVSAITIDELAFGVARAKPDQRVRLRRWFDEFLALPPEIFPVDERVALVAGELRAARAQVGLVPSQADMLIAATALLSGRVLVTRNVKHFKGCGVALLDPFVT